MNNIANRRNSISKNFLLTILFIVCFGALYFAFFFDSNNNNRSKFQSTTKIFNANFPTMIKNSSKVIPKIFLISYSDASAVPGYLHASMIRMCYAQQFSNYQVIIYDEYDLRRFSTVFSKTSHHNTTPPDEVKYWAKLYLMKKTLLRHTRSQEDWVFWIDADAIITRPNLRLETIISTGLSAWRGAKNKIRTLKFHRLVLIQRMQNQQRQQQENNSDQTTLPKERVFLQNGILHKGVTFEGIEYPVAFEEVAIDAVNASNIETEIIPDLLVSNNVNIINNGFFGMRNTIWSHDFLRRWYKERDENPNDVGTSLFHDNGPFLHTLLKVQALHNLVRYDNQCSYKSLLASMLFRAEKRRQGRIKAIRDSKEQVRTKNYSFNNTPYKTKEEQENILNQIISMSDEVPPVNRSYYEGVARGYLVFQPCYINFLRTRIVKARIAESIGRNESHNSSPNHDEKVHDVLSRCYRMEYLFGDVNFDHRDDATLKESSTPTTTTTTKIVPPEEHMADFVQQMHRDVQEAVLKRELHDFHSNGINEFESNKKPLFEWSLPSTSKSKVSASGPPKYPYSHVFSLPSHLGGKAYEYSLIRNDDPFIFGDDCRSNSGLGHLFSPSAQFNKFDSFLMHPAGWRDASVKNTLLYGYAQHVKRRFFEKCF